HAARARRALLAPGRRRLDLSLALSLPDARMSHTKSRYGSPRAHLLVWLALMILATLTLLLSGAHLGGLDVWFALAIAVVKTALVALFFMELVEHRFINSMVLIVSAGFIALLIGLSVADIATRRTFPRGPLPSATTAERE